MIKKLAILLLSAALVCQAQAGAVGVYMGRTSTSDFGDAKTMGAKLEASLIGPVGLEFRGNYYWDFDDKNLNLDDFKMFSGEVGLIGRLPLGIFSLHGGGGAGYYVMPSFDMVMPNGVVLKSDIDDTPGAYLLVGIETGTPLVRLFAEAKYLMLKPKLVRAEHLEYWHSKIDTDLSGLTFQAGLMIRW